MSSSFKVKYFYLLLAMVLLVIQVSSFPSPPKRPDTFKSKQEVKEYLIALHHYYSVITRPRFTRYIEDDENDDNSNNNGDNDTTTTLLSSPPQRPSSFENKQTILNYLTKLHEYYLTKLNETQFDQE
jgi:hypothetical protein